MNWRTLGLIALFSFFSSIALAEEEQPLADEGQINISIDNEPAHNNRPQVLRVTGADGEPLQGVFLHARYYPRTTVQRGEAICKTDQNGTCEWTPGFAGLVRIRADENEPTLQNSGVLTDRAAERNPLHQQTFSIRFDGPPLSGIVMFGIAVTILFGSLAWSMTELLVRAPRRQAAAAAAEQSDV